MSEDMLNVMGSFISTELDAFENLHKELEERDKEIERLNNIIKSARDLFYEKCRISQNGVYTFNQVDYEELDNVLKGSDKE